VGLEGRCAKELVQRLARSVLPCWERICADAGHRCLVLPGDSAWRVLPRHAGDAAGVSIERLDGRVRGVVVLDVREGQIVLRPLRGCGGAHRCGAAACARASRSGDGWGGKRCPACANSHRHSRTHAEACRPRCPTAACSRSGPEPVRSLDEAVRLLSRWAAPRQPLDRAALAGVASLQQQPAAAGDLHKALAALDAAEEAGAAAGQPRGCTM
jgi:hypothetical protein